jgi:dTDP-4-amino-4,6-dideoxygalactose transaminase
MVNIKIPFNKPSIIGKELYYIDQAVLSGKISGDGVFTCKCSRFIKDRYSVKKVLLTTSCSSALDMSAILFNINPGDEVIMPSYTFSSTANSFLIRGAKIKFVDIREDTLNMDEGKIECMITPKTKVIALVHYAGVGCEMDTIMDIAGKNNLLVVEDAAQGIESKYKRRYLGTIGDIGCYSFHETKNVICGEGGAILINNESFSERAEIIREKGTNRSKFFRGEIDKYTWVDIGSSYLPSEIISAFLYAQLENIERINKRRKKTWSYYYDSLEKLEEDGLLKRPFIPDNCEHNAHMFYIILNNNKTRNSLMGFLKNKGILAIFHYIPLHLSPLGINMGYKKGSFPITEKTSDCILRLPLYYALGRNEQDFIVKALYNFFKK